MSNKHNSIDVSYELEKRLSKMIDNSTDNPQEGQGARARLAKIRRQRQRLEKLPEEFRAKLFDEEEEGEDEEG